MIRSVRFVAITLALASPALANPFYMGADASLLPFIESRGGSFSYNNQIAPADRIMVERGANLFRIRLFVNPNPNYSATAGAIQDLNYSIALAQRLKASGASILLDLHYSDTWADPGSQDKPAAWSSLNFATLNSTVRTYTRETLVAFRDAGVMPEMVQVGNEITNGMLFGTSVNPANGGHVVYSGSQATQNQSWMNFGSLLSSAIAGVREADTLTPGQRTDIAIHVDGGNVDGRAQYYFNKLTSVAGVNPSTYDVMGMSFYPASNGTTSLNNLNANLTHLANSYTKKVMVLETNNPWKGPSNGSQWATSEAGQADFTADVRDLVRNLPNGRGAGVVWWYPESVQVSGTFIWQGGAVALFDDDTDGNGADVHDSLAALNEFRLAAPTWNVDADGIWSGAGNWTGGVPGGIGAVARFERSLAAPRTVTLDSARTVGTVSFLSPSAYTLGGATLTLDVASGPARFDVIAGSHTIAAPLVVNDDLQINTAWTSGLTVTSPISAPGRVVAKLGTGLATLEKLDAGTLYVKSGTLAIAASAQPNGPGGASSIDALFIDVGASLDLTNNALSVAHGGATIAAQETIRQHLLAGRMRTSLADAAHRLGYRVAGDEVVVEFALAGDTNLDGQVDINDLAALASAWQAPAFWSAGDFDYSGFVDINDLAMLAGNWQATLAGPSLETALADLGLAGVVVPEPAAALASAGLLLARRRCRKFE